MCPGGAGPGLISARFSHQRMESRVASDRTADAGVRADSEESSLGTDLELEQLRARVAHLESLVERLTGDRVEGSWRRIAFA
jgi:hypothetical protein